MTGPAFGVMHDFRQPRPWRVPLATYYAECLALVEEAEELGYESVWLSEHHGTADGFLPSPVPAALVPMIMKDLEGYSTKESS